MHPLSSASSRIPSTHQARTLLLLIGPLLLVTACGTTAPASATDKTDYWQTTAIRYEDHIYSPTVHTVQLFKQGFELAPPLIELGGQDPLVLRFDDLQPDLQNYSYTVVHCAADWTPSDLMPGQYLTGAMSDYIPSGRQSYNTLQPFIHYEVEIPNGMMQMTRSGNYLLKVYRDSDEEDLVLTRRFMVVEQKVQIEARVLATRNVDLRDAAQQVDLTVRHPGLFIQDPFSDLHVVMVQNMRWDDARTGFKPRFVRDNELVYDFPEQGLFMGANEYRNFDLKNLRFATRNVARIDPGIGAEVYSAFLIPEQKRNIRVYDNQPDINGKFLVRNDMVEGDPLGADYVNVHFALPLSAPLMDEVFVYGGFSDMQCRKEFRMTWSAERNMYELKALLKQGFYDFTFATLPRGAKAADITAIEGSHYQTENDYLVLVYLTDHQQRCDRLVGMRFLNSIRG